jgi:hypothetical protein
MPDCLLEPRVRDEGDRGISRKGCEWKVGQRRGPEMVFAVDVIGQRDDLGRWVRGIAPCAGGLELAAAGVPGLEVERNRADENFFV